MNKKQYRKAKSKFFHNRVYKWYLKNNHGEPIMYYKDGFFKAEFDGNKLSVEDEKIVLELMHMSDTDAFYAAHKLQIDRGYKHFYIKRSSSSTVTLT